MKALYMIIKSGLGKRFHNLPKSPMVLSIYDVRVFRCSFSNVNCSSRIMPRFFWDEYCETWMLVKNDSWWLIFFDFLLKVTSRVSLLRSWLKFFFHWKAQLLILAKSLFLAEILNDRKWKVVLNGQDSDGCYWRSFLRIHSRCFVVFGCINDIATGLSSNVKLTAEKISLFSVTQDKSSNRFLLLPFCFNLKLIPLCLTSSDAFDISRNSYPWGNYL